MSECVCRACRSSRATQAELDAAQERIEELEGENEDWSKLTGEAQRGHARSLEERHKLEAENQRLREVVDTATTLVNSEALFYWSLLREQIAALQKESE